jgi:ribosomal protein L16 Arg81 hydroxylase
VQLIGEKRWQVYAPTLQLPLSHQTSEKFGLAPGLSDFEYLLREGDVLYIPRGWWHEVTPITAQSLHFSIGTYPPTTLDYVMWVCRTQLPQLLDARRACPVDANDPAFAQVMQHLVQEALNQQTVDNFFEAQSSHEKLNGAFHTELALHISTFSEELELSLNSVHAVASNTYKIAVNNTDVKLNASGRALVEVLQQNGTLSWAEVRNLLSYISEESLKQTVLDLSRYELINLHTSTHS